MKTLNSLIAALFVAILAFIAFTPQEKSLSSVSVYAAFPGEGAPAPTCLPGKNCGD